MLYSCFNQQAGLYDYFEDGQQIPINGDLPIPKLPPMAGKIGVPAIHAGRPLPPGAKPAGHGWHARGLIVQCGGGSLSGPATAEELTTMARALILAGIVAGAWFGYKDTPDVAGAIKGAAAGGSAAWLLSMLLG